MLSGFSRIFGRFSKYISSFSTLSFSAKTFKKSRHITFHSPNNIPTLKNTNSFFLPIIQQSVRGFPVYAKYHFQSCFAFFQICCPSWGYQQPFPVLSIPAFLAYRRKNPQKTYADTKNSILIETLPSISP